MLLSADCVLDAAADWWWNPLLEELQKEGCCISADSWSLAVDSKFLQTLHKDTIKQQDVIYGTGLQVSTHLPFFLNLPSFVSICL